MFETLLGDMTLSQIIGDGALIALIVSTLFEISPIKISPITSILTWLGKKMNSQVMTQVAQQDEKIDSLNDKIDALDLKIDMNEVDHIRWEILDFANECREGRRHTKDEFEHIISLNTKYHTIITEHDMKNGLIDLEYAYIEHIYNKCLEENSFL